MTIVQTIATVSHRYYEKRHRRVAQQNIRDMCRALGREVPFGLSDMPKHELVSTAMKLHREMPE